jgi:hypothetical protein
MNPFPMTSNTIKSFLQLIDFSMILATTHIPLPKPFDKPRFQGFELSQLHLNIWVLILE